MPGICQVASPEAFVEVSTLQSAGVPPEILTVPLNILLPFTCILAPGLLVPIPTFPFPRIRTTSVGAVLVVTLRFANTISPWVLQAVEVVINPISAAESSPEFEDLPNQIV